MAETYTIRSLVEEAECAQCGCPLCVGDVARLEADGRVYCSRRCAEGRRRAPQGAERRRAHHKAHCRCGKDYPAE